MSIKIIIELNLSVVLEFRDQLDRCEEIVALIPPLIVNEYLLNAKSQLEQDKINSDNILKEKLLELEKIRVSQLLLLVKSSAEKNSILIISF